MACQVKGKKAVVSDVVKNADIALSLFRLLTVNRTGQHFQRKSNVETLK